MYPRQPSVHLTEDHEAFRTSVADFVAREIRPHADEWEAAGEFRRDLYTKAARAGFLGLRYPPELGGSGLDFFATCVLCEELAKSDSIGTAVGLLAHSEFALSVLVDEASDELKAEYVAPALRGERIGAIGVTEPAAGSDVARITTPAPGGGGGHRNSAPKTVISNG